MTVCRLRTPGTIPGPILRTEFKANSWIQLYFCLDGPPVDPLIQGDFLYNLESVGRTARLSLWFGEGTQDPASIGSFVDTDPLAPVEPNNFLSS